MQTTKYTRKSFDVDAVQVTAENMAEVAEWCGGKVVEVPEGRYIKAKIHRPLSERQTRAYAGDWVLYAANGFKIYTPKAFENGFTPVQADNAKPLSAEELQAQLNDGAGV